MLRVRDALFFEDREGNRFCKIQVRVARVKDTIEIEGDRWQLFGDPKTLTLPGS